MRKSIRPSTLMARPGTLEDCIVIEELSIDRSDRLFDDGGATNARGLGECCLRLLRLLLRQVVDVVSERVWRRRHGSTLWT